MFNIIITVIIKKIIPSFKVSIHNIECEYKIVQKQKSSLCTCMTEYYVTNIDQSIPFKFALVIYVQHRQHI